MLSLDGIPLHKIRIMPSITFIYEYGNEEWSTPSSVMEEFKSRGWNVNRYHLSQMTGLEASELLNSKPDIVMVMDWKGIDIFPMLKTELKKAGTYLVRENGDTPQNYDRHLAVSDGYDLLLTPDYESAERYKNTGYHGLHCIHWPHFTDTRIFYPMDQWMEWDVVSSRGRGGSQFLDYIEDVMGGRFRNRNGFIGEEHASFLRSGLVVLQNSRHKEWTRRIPEAMSLGKLVITDRLPSSTRIEDHYVDGEDIVYYDGVADCLSKINYYTSKEGREDRNRIADNGYRKTTLFHTQAERVNSIINQYNIWKTHS